MKKIKINKHLLYCILFTIIGFGILFCVSGIYPFGSKQINLLDFDGGYIPVYYKLWDVLHFNSSALWDWNLGSGLNAFGSLIGNGLISPLCWIIGLFPRSSIPYTISYVYLLKMVFVSIISYYAISKILPDTKEKHKVLFSLMYTFSSWTFMMSTNLLYIDAFAIFPLLVYSLKELLDKGHWKLYTCLLTMTLLMSYYIAWLDLFFIIGTTGIYLLTMNVDKKKEKAVKVFVCTLLSLLFSCILFLPGFMLARGSTRMANNTSSALIFSFFMDKSVYLFTLAIPFVLTIKQLFVKKEKKLRLFIILMLVFLLLGVIIEPINALWHTGSHSGFPFRYAYEPTFFMILISLYYLNNNHKYEKKSSLFRRVIPIAGLVAVFIVFMFLAVDLISKNQFASEVTNVAAYLTLLFFFVALTLIYIISLKNKEKVFYSLTISTFVVTTIIFGFLYEKFIPFYTSTEAEKIKENFNLIDDHYNYMTEITDVNINIPYILEVPSKTNRIHFIRQELLDETIYMGYDYHDTIIYAKAGNMFNNLLLQNKYYLTEQKMDSKYYDLIEEHDGIYYYRAKNNLNYLLPYNGNIYNEKNNDIFDNSNNIYKKLFNGKDNIYNKVDYSLNNNELRFKTLNDYRYEIRIDYQDELEYEIIGTPLYEYMGNKYLRLSFIGNGNEIIIKTKGDITNNYVYELNHEEFINFVNNNQASIKVEIDGNKKIYTYEALNDTSVLLPINYDDNYVIKVNNKKVDYKLNLYNMLSIDVKKGTNVIEVSYEQKWFKYGIMITIGSLLLFGLLYLINKKYRFLNSRIVVWPIFVLTCLIFIFLILKVYLLSLF